MESPIVLVALQLFQVGYKEPEGIEAKQRRRRGSGEEGGEDREDREDEAPTVVVLREGDLAEEEVKAMQAEKKAELVDEGPPKDGKIR